MDRAEKAQSIETLKGVFADAGAVVVTHYMGLTVAEMTDLRGRLRKEGASLKVVKNTLVQKALDGSVGEKGDALFKGPVAIAYGPDVSAAAKVSTAYAKENETVLDQAGVGALATLPSLDQIRSSLIGLINAPATKVAGVLQAPAGQLARVFNAYATKDAA